jgi:DNA polymerase III subunit alpha
MSQYCIYHLHSDMSNGVTNIDSVTKFQKYIDRAKETGMKAMAFSEHGSVFAWDLKKEAIEKAGMKYIHAEEFYITQTLEEKVRDNWHCVLIGKNWDGVRELNYLASKSFNRKDNHFFYVPRITIDDLLNTSDDIIITSACLGGPLNHAPENIVKQLLEFMSKNKQRCFLEIQHHNVSDQRAYNLQLVQWSKEYGIPLIAGTDTHSLDEIHAEGRKILQKSKDICFGDEDGWDLSFKTYDELCEAYRKQGTLSEEVYLTAIENTNKMADMVEEFVLDRHTKYPKIYDDPVKTFKQKINEGYKNNEYIHQRYSKKEVLDRVQEELAVYEKVGAIDFMLLETYIREWEKSVGIHSGPGRGSVSGSMIAYLLNITKMDSLKFHLNFFRFMNPARVTNADIDTDYYSEDREKLKYFLLHDRMNLSNIKTSEIITFNTIALKGAIRDVCRALYKKDQDDDGEYLKIADAICADVERDEDGMRKKYPEVFKYVDIVNGTIVSIGSHPSGVLVSDRDIERDVGLCSISTSDYPVSMLDMHGLDGQMYVKLDVLGLDNLGVINQTCELAGIDYLTPDNVDLDDEKVWKSIRDDTTLIFQWESDSAQAYLKKFMSDETIAKIKAKSSNFSYLKWFSFGNGLLRPACASYRDEVSGGDFYDNGFKELNEFLAPEAGRVCMQETIMMFLVKFCGYSQAESDSVRRAIAKKKGTETLLPEIEQRFIEYSSTHYNITKEKCQEVIKPFLQIILDASDYGFSWNHSDAYSSIGYISGYLRYYYPLEFLTASLNIFSDKEEKTTAITNYARKVGITIKDIKFGHSKADYSMEKETNSIYKGIASIKYMSADVANKLYDLAHTQKFDSFIDLLRVFPGDSRQLEILIKLNYFSQFAPIGKLLNIVELYNKFGTRKTLKESDVLSLPMPVQEIIAKYTVKPKTQYKITDSDGMLRDLAELTGNRPITMMMRLNWEKELLGYCASTDPSQQGSWLVLDIDTKYSPKLSIYAIWSGEQRIVKVSKRDFQSNPLTKGDTIRLTIEQRPKAKLVDGQWVKDESVKEDWLKYYSIVK